MDSLETRGFRINNIIKIIFKKHHTFDTSFSHNWGVSGFVLVSWFLWSYYSLTDKIEFLHRSYEIKNLFEETNQVVSSSKAFLTKGRKQLMSYTKRFLLFCAKETVTVGCAMTSLSAGRLLSRHLSHALFSSTVQNWNFYLCTLAGKEIVLNVGI